MKHNILTILLFSIISGLLSQSVFAAKDQAELLKAQCENITPQQRQMAKMAGYNLDEICSSIPDMNDLKNGKDASRQNVVPRGTQYQTDDRGVIERDSVEGIMLQGSDKIKMPGSFKTASSGKIKKYGYDLFAGLPTTFAPADDIPVPASYVVGPGDVFQIQLLGKENQQHNLTVNRDGSIHFPELGPIGLSGLSFVDAKKLIEEKIAEQMIGVRAVISMGELRSIRIFVLGEAFKPGSYTVSSLSTMTNALFVSGGVKEIGSLRKIQLKRNGKVVTTLDLYDLLQKGDTRKDVRLLPGDVIYIPPVGATVGIDGEVKRPAIYELKNEKNLSQLIDLAGGYSPEAFPNVSHITRKNKNGFTTVIDVDLSQKSGKNTSLKNGDMVEVSTVLEDFEDVVHLKGNFHRPRAVKWHNQLKLTDVIHSIQDFQQNTDLNTGLIIRREMPLRKISVKHFNLQQVIEKKFDLPLQPLDEIMVFANDNTRLSDLALVNLELKTQTTDGSLSKIVDITGNVRYPGTYPLSDAMDVKTLIALAGGLAEATFLGNAEITRRDVANNDLATVEHFNINLSEELSGNTRFRLSAKDKLAVFVTPEYREQLTIVLSGEVRFPGKYEFRRGETLTQVIDRAGGFTPMAHVKAAVFSRDDLKQQERKQLKALQEQMREDIAASQLENTEAGKGASVKDAEALLDALDNTEALGRLVINLESIMTGKSNDLHLKDGDSLMIPTYRQEVSVVGEVQHATAHLFNDELTVEDYLEKSGGLTNRADEERIYVVRADGSVFLPNQSGWLTHQNEMLEPGDTIVIPLDTDRIKSLTLWTGVSQIVYQLALGAAAVSRL